MKRVLSFVLAAAMILSCCTGLGTKAVAAENDTVVVTENGSTVVIGNGYISREVSTAGGKLSTTEIVNKRADEVFTPAQHKHFKFGFACRSVCYFALFSSRWICYKDFFSALLFSDNCVLADG